MTLAATKSARIIPPSGPGILVNVLLECTANELQLPEEGLRKKEESEDQLGTSVHEHIRE